MSSVLMPEPPLSWQGNPDFIEARKPKKKAEVPTDSLPSLLLETDELTPAGAPE